ncbi:MAG TPA: hypothetical protein VL221_09545 [Bacteroidota bacterium]|nr:hypothetical protein [Bacteroidota bacterium]
MKHLMAVCTLFLAMAFVAAAAQAKTTTLRGYVVDKACAGKMAQKSNAMEKAEGHTKDCALNDQCSASGYGIFSAGKFTPFDDAGSAKAKTMIEKSKREKGLYFEAKGTITDGTMAVTSLKEMTPKATMMKKGT